MLVLAILEPALEVGMRSRTVCLAVMLVLASFVLAKQRPLPKLVLNAKYVLVTTRFGVGPTFRITTENRHAVADVQNAIRQWGRYTLVYTPEAADLIFLVRTGQLLEGRALVRTGPQQTIPPDVDAAESTNLPQDVVGGPEDMLAVYDAKAGPDSAPLWQGRDSGGLNPPNMQLLKEFRKNVEAAAQKP
jgi:hypothetical protein